MRTCGEVAELAWTADHLGFDALCRELCKSSSESYANHPVKLDDLGGGACSPKASATYALKYFDSLEKVGSLLEVPEIRGTLSTAAVRFSRRAMDMCSRCARRIGSWCKSWRNRESVLIGAMRRCR